MVLPLTLDRQERAFYARHLLLGALDQADRGIDGLLVTTVHKEEGALKGPVLVRLRVLLDVPPSSGRAQKLREDQQLLLQLSLTVSDRLRLCLLLDLLHIRAVKTCELVLLLLQLCLEVCVELLVLLHLLLKGGQLGLELGLLEGGGTLVLVDLALSDELVKRDIGVRFDHSVGLVHGGELLVDRAHVLDEGGDVRVLGAGLEGLGGGGGCHCELVMCK